MKRKSIIEQVNNYCASASPDAIELLREIVNGYAKKKPTTDKAAPRSRKAKVEAVSPETESINVQ